MEKFNLITNSAVELGDDLTAESNGKGRKFVSRFIESGVAHYENFGDVLITKETLNKFINTMVGCPVIIKHKDITDENADKERVGVVSDVWFNENDGWFYCSGIIWNKQAIDLVKNQGWNVSCTYDFESDKEAKTHNGKKIDMEFTDGNFLHLALVDNPRYERANIVVNSKDIVENDKWITVKPNGEDETGRHLLIKDGEDVGDAMRRQWGVQAKGQQNLFTAKERKSFKLEKKEEQPKEDKTPKYMDSKKEGNTELFYDDDEEEYYTQDYFDAISKDYDNFMKAKKEENKPFEISEDYKNSVKDYTKEKHEQAADFYGEKMATAQKKSVANPDNEDYKKQFEEYQAYTHWHEEQAQSHFP